MLLLLCTLLFITDRDNVMLDAGMEWELNVFFNILCITIPNSPDDDGVYSY